MICAHLYVLGSTGTKRCEDDRVFQNSIRLSATFDMNNLQLPLILSAKAGLSFRHCGVPPAVVAEDLNGALKITVEGGAFIKPVGTASYPLFV